MLPLPTAAAYAQPATIETLTAELAQARSEIEAQKRALEAQEARLRALEARVQSAAATTASPAPGAPGTAIASNDRRPPATGAPAGVEQVGEAPPEIEMPQVAVLGDQGSIVTRAGQFTAEASFEYSRADRNRALFRGVEIVESVLIGVFDINESRQDVLTTSASLRYGVTDRLEIGVRLPFIYRSDSTILTPVTDPELTVDSSAKGKGIGDIELSARYQLLSGRVGRPFLIGNLQAVVPTGTSPFEVPRNAVGGQLEAATGAGFWAVGTSLTAILPSDPAVLFGTVGYTHNFGDEVDTIVGPVQIERVEPGGAVSGSFGLGVSLNQRTSFNLGYAHSWVFGTETRTRLVDPPPNDPGPVTNTSRDLQLGRFLFGVTYRLNNRANVNWAVEVGATEDATDLRAVIRIPVVL
jgi:uncharacterized coiled-coil protein SlyX